MQVVPWDKRNPDTVKVTVRGLEICRWDAFTRDWVVVGKFKATELAARQAATETKWLNERHPYELYQLRAVVSLPKGVAIPTEQSTPTIDPIAEAVVETHG